MSIYVRVGEVYRQLSTADGHGPMAHVRVLGTTEDRGAPLQMTYTLSPA